MLVSEIPAVDSLAFHFAACFKHGTTYSIAGVDPIQAKSALDCQQQCFAQDGCNYFTYSEDEASLPNACWLLEHIGGVSEKSHFISGDKECAGVQCFWWIRLMIPRSCGGGSVYSQWWVGSFTKDPLNIVCWGWVQFNNHGQGGDFTRNCILQILQISTLFCSSVNTRWGTLVPARNMAKVCGLDSPALGCDAHFCIRVGP